MSNFNTNDQTDVVARRWSMFKMKRHKRNRYKMTNLTKNCNIHLSSHLNNHFFNQFFLRFIFILIYFIVLLFIFSLF